MLGSASAFGRRLWFDGVYFGPPKNLGLRCVHFCSFSGTKHIGCQGLPREAIRRLTQRFAAAAAGVRGVPLAQGTCRRIMVSCVYLSLFVGVFLYIREPPIDPSGIPDDLRIETLHNMASLMAKKNSKWLWVRSLLVW